MQPKKKREMGATTTTLKLLKETPFTKSPLKKGKSKTKMNTNNTTIAFNKGDN